MTDPQHPHSSSWPWCCTEDNRAKFKEIYPGVHNDPNKTTKDVADFLVNDPFILGQIHNHSARVCRRYPARKRKDVRDELRHQALILFKERCLKNRGHGFRGEKTDDPCGFFVTVIAHAVFDAWKKVCPEDYWRWVRARLEEILAEVTRQLDLLSERFQRDDAEGDGTPSAAGPQADGEVQRQDLEAKQAGLRKRLEMIDKKLKARDTKSLDPDHDGLCTPGEADSWVRELWQEVTEAILRLPGRQKAVMTLLRSGDTNTLANIASRLGLKVDQVRYARDLAIRQIRRELGGCED